MADESHFAWFSVLPSILLKFGYLARKHVILNRVSHTSMTKLRISFWIYCETNKTISRQMCCPGAITLEEEMFMKPNLNQNLVGTGKL